MKQTKNCGVSSIYFFDTYAFIEIIKGNESYEKYKQSRFMTSLLNIIELHYAILKNFNKTFATELTKKYLTCAIPIELVDIEKGNVFRLEHIKKKISTADAIGYMLALKHDVKFLTGDEDFRGMPNVEFVK